jgi:ABC-2 type transport system permease protein
VLEETTIRVIELLLATMKPEQLMAVITPITILVVIPFAASFSVINDPTSHTTVLLSLVLFFAPILMPTLIALSATSAGQVVLAAAGLTAATIVALAILGGRICGNSVLGVVRLAVEGGWTCWP